MAGPDNPPEQAQYSNRRSAERLPILGEFRGEAMVFQPMVVIDIARGGVKVETAFPFQIESLHELRMAMGEQTVVVKGRVTHCSIFDVDLEVVRYRSGFQFVEAPERVQSAIALFVDAVKDRRRGVYEVNTSRIDPI